MTPYYYSSLSKEEKSVYDALKSGMVRMQTSIRIPKTDNARLGEIFLRLKMDEPLLFYPVSYSCRFYPQAEHMEFLPEYLFKKEKIAEHQKAVLARIERLTKPLKGLPPLVQEQAIHDFILENVHYDKLKKSYSHEVLGPLTQGVGVCEGIAKTVKALCDALGLDCIVVLGENAPEKGIKYRHAWNILTIGGKRYHLDATFDNTLQHGGKRYDYFNLDDRHIFSDHQPPVLPLPACSDDRGFYYRTLSFTKQEDAEKRFSQILRKKQPIFVFHWRGGGLNRQILAELLSHCQELAAAKEKSILCSVNAPQSVIQFTLTDRASSAEENIPVEQPDLYRIDR